MWVEGNFKEEYKSINEELKKIEGDIDDIEKAHYLLYKFLRANLNFTYNLLTGGELYPFQIIKLNTMLRKDYCIDVSSRGLSKSYLAAIFCILYALLNPESKVIVVSQSFKQSKRILMYIKEIIEKPSATLLQEIFKKKEANEEWTYRIGSSQITALPLAIGGGKIRGYRANCVIVDEALEFSDSVLKEVVMPFLVAEKDSIRKQKIHEIEESLIRRGMLKKEDKIVHENPKLILLSSACFKFQDFYRRFESYIEYITNKEYKKSPIKYAVMNFSCDIAPAKLLSRAVIEDARNTMSKSEFDREYGGQFTDDSDGYFSTKKMELCTEQFSPTIEIKGDPDYEYILAVDPNYKDSVDSDHFAMCVLKISKDRKCAHVVHNYAIAGVSLEETAFYFHYILKNFNIVYIIMDSGGSNQVLQFLNGSKYFQDSKINLKKFESEFSEEDEKSIKEARNSYNRSEWKIVHEQNFSSQWIRESNEDLQGAFEHQRIKFGAPLIVDYTDLDLFDKVPIENLKFDNSSNEKLAKKAKLLEFIEHQTALVKLVKQECAAIELKITAQGHQSFDLPPKMKKEKGPNKARKDSYTALLLGNWAFKQYKILKEGKVKKTNNSWIPKVF